MTLLVERKLEWLYLDLNSYFATIEQQLNPKLRNKPIVVVAVMTDSTCAISVSKEAKAKGIKTGTPIYEAKKKCPELICVLAHHDSYVEYHNKIFEEVDKYVCVDHIFSIDECACRLTGKFKEKEEAVNLAKQIKAGIKEIGDYITCSIGLAPNKFLAKIATGIQKYDGLTVITESDIPEKLYQLDLRDIPGIGSSTYRRFTEKGITSIEELYKLDIKTLSRIWGNVQGERCWHLLRGTELPYIESERKTIGHSQVLAPEKRVIEKAVIVAHRLLLKSASRLRRLNYHSTSLGLSVQTEDDKYFKNNCKFESLCDSITLFKKLMPLWENLVKKYNIKSIKKVSITLYGLIKNEDVQPTLFGQDESLKKREKLSTVIDQLNKKFGKDSVVIGMLPEESGTETKIAFSRIPDEEEFFE